MIFIFTRQMPTFTDPYMNEFAKTAGVDKPSYGMVTHRICDIRGAIEKPQIIGLSQKTISLAIAEDLQTNFLKAGKSRGSDHRAAEQLLCCPDTD